MSEMDIHDGTVEETDVDEVDTGLEAPEADAVEQSQIVEEDEDEYR